MTAKDSSSPSIGVTGCGGRMGRLLMLEILARGFKLAGATERAGSVFVGRDAGTLLGQEEIGVIIEDNPEALFAAKPSAVIDFTAPMATERHVQLAVRHGVPLVIGTTGHTDKQLIAIKEAARNIALLKAANMSVGVNLLLDLVKRAAARLPENGYDIEILEMHHSQKVDAPSGTALALGEAAAKGRGIPLKDASDRARDGHTGARTLGNIGFAVLRGGDVAGEHSVIFAGAGERIELTHKATDRAIFARGAVTAAAWLAKRQPGLYGMSDVLELADI